MHALGAITLLLCSLAQSTGLWYSAGSLQVMGFAINNGSAIWSDKVCRDWISNQCQHYLHYICSTTRDAILNHPELPIQQASCETNLGPKPRSNVVIYLYTYEDNWFPRLLDLNLMKVLIETNSAFLPPEWSAFGGVEYIRPLEIIQDAGPDLEDEYRRPQFKLTGEAVKGPWFVEDSKVCRDWTNPPCMQMRNELCKKVIKVMREHPYFKDLVSACFVRETNDDYIIRMAILIYRNKVRDADSRLLEVMLPPAVLTWDPRIAYLATVRQMWTIGFNPSKEPLDHPSRRRLIFTVELSRNDIQRPYLEACQDPYREPCVLQRSSLCRTALEALRDNSVLANFSSACQALPDANNNYAKLILHAFDGYPSALDFGLVRTTLRKSIQYAPSGWSYVSRIVKTEAVGLTNNGPAGELKLSGIVLKNGKVTRRDVECRHEDDCRRFEQTLCSTTTDALKHPELSLGRYECIVHQTTGIVTSFTLRLQDKRIDSLDFNLMRILVQTKSLGKPEGVSAMGLVTNMEPRNGLEDTGPDLLSNDRHRIVFVGIAMQNREIQTYGERCADEQSASCILFKNELCNSTINSFDLHIYFRDLPSACFAVRSAKDPLFVEVHIVLFRNHPSQVDLKLLGIWLPPASISLDSNMTSLVWLDSVIPYGVRGLDKPLADPSRARFVVDGFTHKDGMQTTYNTQCANRLSASCLLFNASVCQTAIEAMRTVPPMRKIYSACKLNTHWDPQQITLDLYVLDSHPRATSFGLLEYVLEQSASVAYRNWSYMHQVTSLYAVEMGDSGSLAEVKFTGLVLKNGVVAQYNLECAVPSAERCRQFQRGLCTSTLDAITSHKELQLKYHGCLVLQTNGTSGSFQLRFFLNPPTSLDFNLMRILIQTNSAWKPVNVSSMGLVTKVEKVRGISDTGPNLLSPDRHRVDFAVEVMKNLDVINYNDECSNEESVRCIQFRNILCNKTVTAILNSKIFKPLVSACFVTRNNAPWLLNISMVLFRKHPETADITLLSVYLPTATMLLGMDTFYIGRVWNFTTIGIRDQYEPLVQHNVTS